MTEFFSDELKVVAANDYDSVLQNRVLLNPKDYSILTANSSAKNSLNYFIIGAAVFQCIPSIIVEQGTLPLSLIQRSASRLNINDIFKPLIFFPLHTDSSFLLKKVIIEIYSTTPHNTGIGDTITIKEEQFKLHLLNNLYGSYFVKNQDVMMQYNSNLFHLNIFDMVGSLEFRPFMMMNYDTEIVLISKSEKIRLCQLADSANSAESTEPEEPALFDRSYLTDISKLSLDIGVGGLNEQIQELFRKAFVSRLIPNKLLKKLGINHVRGILLYGPPGCGKTLFARQISKLLNSHPPKIVNGPELLSKFVGQSEENARNLFLEAEKEYQLLGDKSKLHVIIFDEIDALCKKRGGESAAASNTDGIVNQLLTKIDGINALNNILVIGMTNRKDIIDEAMLRPGRFEVHIEIGKPNLQGRIEIFKIHTQNMRKNNILSEDVNIEKLAELTEGYSGAEIESLIKNTVNEVLYGHLSALCLEPIGSDSKESDSFEISMQNFLISLYRER